jgi:hypothetical protein
MNEKLHATPVVRHISLSPCFSSCFNEMQMNIIGAPVPKVIFHENVAAVKVVQRVVCRSAALIYIRSHSDTLPLCK